MKTMKQNMTERNKSILKQAFKTIFEENQIDELTVAEFFSKDYQQWVDGHQLDYQGFLQHLKAQRQKIATISIEFKSVVAEKNKVATIHQVEAITQKGNPVKGKVIAHFTFENDKILSCEELTFFTEAKEEDRDLGSVR
ncbi:nuclear transport factor 2 family protein [Legionella israelensis]|nr:nuclear transport factor 2 family protein [Legionella israelensis]